MSIPTKTYPDATMSLAGPDAHADNVNADIACQENRISPGLVDVIDAWEGVIHRWVMRYSMTALRISMGLMALGFGVLKYFPGSVQLRISF